MHLNLLQFKKNAFWESAIENLTIPPKLIELKNDWCYNTPKLNKINVNPLN